MVDGPSCLETIQRFQGPSPPEKIKYLHTAKAREIIYAAEKLDIRGARDNPPPGDSRANGVAENNVERTTTSPLQRR
jgi:hypothetical protein